ncbi:MAG: LamB/YcsF family protein [Clostridia bacterium]|nr:LamB/YcsF family protein [Clostridia bacterium]
MKINCDFGEGYGNYDFHLEENVINQLDLINVACGFHGGDPEKIIEAIKRGMKHDLKIGAHPGYYDLRGFGRIEMHLPMKILYSDLVYQLCALEGICKVLGTKLYHVKPHGALYNQCAEDEQLAETVVRAIKDVNKDLVVVGLSGSKFLSIAESNGLKTLHEVFADRRYESNGQLMSRQQQGALLSLEDSLEQIMNLKAGYAVTEEGNKVLLRADTICIHGDGQHVNALLSALKGMID